jgi:hypothetical protein
MKKIILLIILISSTTQAQNNETKLVNTMLDAWHKAAAEVRFNDYFNAMANESVYIGTDATENWNKKAYMAYAKPHFDKGKAWSFTALERNVYFDASYKIAWFDELLDTQMKICRGSGILEKVGTEWKIKHYVLSMTIPNDNTKEVVKTKTPIEDKLILSLKQK